MIKQFMFSKPQESGGLPMAGWDYRKSITISRASGAVTNYQMKILVGESSGATGEDVDCESHVLSTFADLRFTTSDGETLLDYWIESISGATPNQLATVWVEFDSIGTGDTTFYMYYGNAGAESASSGANTFIAFENFEWGADEDLLSGSGGTITWTAATGVGGRLDTAKAYGGSKSGRFTGAGAYSIATTPVSFDATIDIGFRFWKDNAPTRSPELGGGNGTKRFSLWFDQNEQLTAYYGSATHTLGVYCTPDAWQSMSIRNINFTAGTYDIYLNGASAATNVSMQVDAFYNGVVGIGTVSTNTSYSVWCDDFKIRQCLATEPVISAYGAEEAL